MQNSIYAVYGQDSWRLRRNLTLNLGLRWEVNTSRRGRNAVNYALFGGAIITPPRTTWVWGKLYNQYNGITNFNRASVSRAAGLREKYSDPRRFRRVKLPRATALTICHTESGRLRPRTITFAPTTNLPGSTLDQGL
jgi:outer membrane receptor protein involved in Fe transport